MTSRATVVDGVEGAFAIDPGASHVPPLSDPRDPRHLEWLIDEGADGSFPASDPSSVAMPHRRG